MKFSLQICTLLHEKRHWAIACGVDDAGKVVASAQLDYWDSAEPFLCRVFVDHDQRRKGIGEKLIRFVMDECAARGKRTLSMYVDLRNAPAQSLYRKLGFEHFFTEGDNKFLSKLLKQDAQVPA